MKAQNFTINYLIICAKYFLFLNQKKKKIENLDVTGLRLYFSQQFHLIPNVSQRSRICVECKVPIVCLPIPKCKLSVPFLVVPRERWRVGDTTGCYRSVYPYIPLCACTGYAVKMLHTLKIGEEENRYWEP